MPLAPGLTLSCLCHLPLSVSLLPLCPVSAVASLRVPIHCAVCCGHFSVPRPSLFLHACCCVSESPPLSISLSPCLSVPVPSPTWSHLAQLHVCFRVPAARLPAPASAEQAAPGDLKSLVPVPLPFHFDVDRVQGLGGKRRGPGWSEDTGWSLLTGLSTEGLRPDP